MAEALGVTVERLSAGESGAARFGARLLLDICRLLQCLPAEFFEAI
jgi:DNA-binding Xre family transcriptional regulator